MNGIEKNVARGTFTETSIDTDFLVLTYQNESEGIETVERNIENSFIQFHFCIKGKAAFQFNNGNYTLNINEQTSLLLYNPQRDLPINLDMSPDSALVSILISIKKFHGLFSQEADYISFLSDDNKDKKYYKDGKVSPSVSIVLNQLIHYNLNQSIKNL